MRPLDFLLYAVGIFALAAVPFILAVGAKVWSAAASAAHTARSHGAQADETADTLRMAREAAQSQFERQPRRPTDDEIRAAILAERQGGNGEVGAGVEYTTSGEVTPDELTSYMAGGEYRT
jgi:hypothetical protein